jgi:hypothetical protein
MYAKDFIYKLQRTRDEASKELELLLRKISEDKDPEVSTECRLLLLFVSDFLPYAACRDCFARSLQRTRRNEMFTFHRDRERPLPLSQAHELLLWLSLGASYTGMVVFVFVYGSMASARAQQTALGAFLLWIFTDPLMVKSLSVFLQHVCVQSLLSDYVRRALRYVERHIHDYSAMSGGSGPSNEREFNACHYYFVSHQFIQSMREEDAVNTTELNAAVDLISAFKSSVSSYDAHPIASAPIMSKIVATSGVALISASSLWGRYVPAYVHDCVVETLSVLLTFCIVISHLLLFEQSPVFAFIPLLIILSLLVVLVYLYLNSDRPRQYTDHSKLVIPEPTDSDVPLFTDVRHLIVPEKRNLKLFDDAYIFITGWFRRTLNIVRGSSRRRVAIQDHVVSEFSQILQPSSSITAIEFDGDGDVRKSKEVGMPLVKSEMDINGQAPIDIMELDTYALGTEKLVNHIGNGKVVVREGPRKTNLSSEIDESKDEIFAGPSLYSACSRVSAKSASSSATGDDISVLKDLDFWKMKRKHVEIKITRKDKKKNRKRDKSTRVESNHTLSRVESGRATKRGIDKIPEYYEMIADKPTANGTPNSDGKVKVSLADLFAPLGDVRAETEAAYMDINWDGDGFDIEHWQK